MIWRRILRAIQLDATLYEEVEADKGATVEALIVVVLSSLAAGIGISSTVGGVGFIGGAIATLVSWMVWAGVILLIGTKLLPEPETHSDMGELLRTVGFSSSPGLFRVFGIFHPTLNMLLSIASNLWMLAAMVLAVKHALDYRSTARAAGVVAIGWLLQVAVLGGIYALLLAYS